ncbi:hypothetical protein Loa_00905 [Legionella oakridgensis ATCC 33761 = DSM 21215]|uniref:Uncharacterized protein n=1 Tax=Legionella oakridgensis ATCC 33761 = DSM 21215 TaxID=1268635 RepID=W0BCW3_9GAMM|nr:hypothetical protein Loa_00905 [Legionella oakridgensis ATCC 33761 = DSM 21215]
MKDTRKQPSTRAKLNTNSPDTHAWQTCSNTKYAPYRKKVTCVWSVIKSVSANHFMMRKNGALPLKQHPFLANHSFYLTSLNALLEQFAIFVTCKCLAEKNLRLICKFIRPIIQNRVTFMRRMTAYKKATEQRIIKNKPVISSMIEFASLFKVLGHA